MKIDEYDPVELDEQAKRCEKLWRKVFDPPKPKTYDVVERRTRRVVPTPKMAEAALCQLITGFTTRDITEEFREVERDGIISVKRSIAKIVYKHVAPNAQAVICALTNLIPEKYKNKQSVENTGKDGGPIKFEEVGAAKELLASRIAGLASGGAKGSDTEGVES
jgi:hypothetical protein